MREIEKELVLFALRHAKDLIEFMASQFPKTGKPPIGFIDDAIKVVKTGELPWEKKR